MWIRSLIVLIVVLTMAGCSPTGNAGMTDMKGRFSVTLTSSPAFQSQNFAIGCFIKSSRSIKCLCYEKGKEYIGRASGSRYCKNVANDVDLVSAGTLVQNVPAGDHFYCSTNNRRVVGNICSKGEANTSVATLSAPAGDTGTAKHSGQDEGEINYTITFSETGRSIEKN